MMKQFYMTIIVALISTSVNASEEIYNNWMEKGKVASFCYGQSYILGVEHLEEIISSFGDDKALEVINLGEENNNKFIETAAAPYKDERLSKLWSQRLLAQTFSDVFTGATEEGMEFAESNYKLKGLKYTVKTYLDYCK